MNIKKFFVGLVLVVSIGFAAWSVTEPQRASENSATISPSLNVAVRILDDGPVATASGLTAGSVLEALQAVAARNNLVVRTKQYDFGVLVEQIGDRANTNDRAWIYFVNSVSGDVAADKKELNDGDVVEWKYIRPEF